MRDLSPIMIASNEERKRKKFDGDKIATVLKGFNVPALPSDKQAIDVLWYVDGQCVACDCKTPEDFIASYMDGRLHDQITAMQNMECKFYFLLIEGDPWSYDGGHMVGGQHGWTWDQFDDAMFDVQVYGGVQIVRSPSKELTPRRLAALWRWTGKDEAASWHSPVPIIPSSDFSPGGVIFFDKGYRNRVGVLMHAEGWGVKAANTVLETMTLGEAMGSTPEGRAEAEAKLKGLKGLGPKRIQAWKELLTR